MSALSRRTVIAMGGLLAAVPGIAMAAEGAVRPLTAAAIRRRLLATIGATQFSGAVLLLQNGRPVFGRAVGLRDRAAESPNLLGTRFNIASTGKMFTALAILRLVEAERLRLDSRLIELWPDYPDRRAAAEITVEALLTHRAGLGNYVINTPRNNVPASVRQSDFVPLFADKGRAATAGQMAYSNDGFVLLGALIERLTGAAYRDHLRRTIFEPLGMSRTGDPDPLLRAPDLAVPYVRDLTRPRTMARRDC